MKPLFSTLAVVAALLPALGEAQSDRHQRAVELAREAHELFEAGDAAGAEELLEEALVIAEDPALYYNLARTREHMEEWEGAASAYRAFIARRPDDPRIPAVQERLRTIDERIAELETADAELEALDEEAKETPPREESLREEEAAPPEAATPGPARWTWGLMGAGAAVGAFGIVMGLVSRGQVSDAREADSGAEGQESLDDARRSAVLANAAMGIGGACLIGGIVGAFVVTRGRVAVDTDGRGAVLRVRGRF